MKECIFRIAEVAVRLLLRPAYGLSIQEAVLRLSSSKTATNGTNDFLPCTSSPKKSPRSLLQVIRELECTSSELSSAKCWFHVRYYMA